MTLYHLTSAENTGGDRIDLKDSRGRLFGYFMWGTDEGKFLRYTTPRGKAQEWVTSGIISRSDFLESNIGIPLFSEKAKDVFERCIPGVMEFQPLIIECEGAEYPFFLCKLLTRYEFIDGSRSTFVSLGDSGRMIDTPVYRDDIDDKVYIARDINHPAHSLATDAFVKLCRYHHLNIGFYSRSRKTPP